MPSSPLLPPPPPTLPYAQLVAERETSERLQALVASERSKEYHSQLAGQEREIELQQLRQQLTRLEADRWVGLWAGLWVGSSSGGAVLPTFRLSLTEQLRSARSEAVLKAEEGQRLRTELASAKFQKCAIYIIGFLSPPHPLTPHLAMFHREHVKQQLHQLRGSSSTWPHPLPPPAHEQQPHPLPLPAHEQQPDSLVNNLVPELERSCGWVVMVAAIPCPAAGGQ